ncbi:MAG TPA: threonine--tRNA ligase [Acidimicrobiales bacterium]|nr:threonine--tRNA ligase [Acidimicrobiales bacterium]
MDHPDHRRLGRELGIFATDEQVGAGLPLWLPAGAAIRAEIERFVVKLERRHGYQHVYTPELGKRQLYERSGHWQHYEEDMYPPMRVGGDQVVLRPMNCPHHILVFDAEPRSLRAMPVRLAELGTMFRLERSGVVGGLSRVRQMTLNDGHVFCAMEHIGDEIASILGMVAEAYQALAIPPPRLRLSLRGEGPKYAGDGAAWELSEEMLRRSLDDHGVAYDEASDEAAFYGPKIDLQVTDPQGREETLSTVQVDFYLPGRFDLSFRRGERSERPVMIHRSIVSTMERMVAHLLEVHRGALPPWLAPTQVVVVPVAEDASSHARAVRRCLHDRDVRVELDDRDATLASRIRDAQQRHVPYVAVVGRREAESGTVAVRLRDSTRLDPRPVDAFLGLLDMVIATRTAALLPAGGAS